jgi:hypothetical protein
MDFYYIHGIYSNTKTVDRTIYYPDQNTHCPDPYPTKKVLRSRIIFFSFGSGQKMLLSPSALVPT